MDKHNIFYGKEAYTVHTYQPDFDIESAVLHELSYMIHMREQFHAHPELSGREHETSQTILHELQKAGIEDARIIADTGVTGLIRGALPGPVLLLRADMDALPLTEQYSCSYTSQTPGVTHACGHDGHTANLLGVARILQAHRNCLRGTIRLAFQPAEEGDGGAARMIEAGILHNPHVDYALGLHVAGGLPQGYIGLRHGECSASCDDFTITIHGKGGHGSRPSDCISPIQMGVSIISQIQDYVYHKRADGDGVVLTFGQFQSGHNPNVIPDTAELKGTLRTYNEKKRQDILETLQHILTASETIYGGTCQLHVVPFSPVCINDDAVTSRVESILRHHMADRIQLITMERGSGSEDFAYFSAAVPSCFYYTGIYDKEPVFGHNPDFHWDSHALQYMAESMLTLVYYFAG